MSPYQFVNDLVEAWEEFDGDDVSTFIQEWADKLESR